MAGLLDNFNRADESALNNGGKWSGPAFPGNTVVELLTNRAAGKNSAFCDAYWTTKFAANQIAGGEIAAKTTSRLIGHQIRIQNPNTSNINCYALGINTSTNLWEVASVVKGKETLLKSATKAIAVTDRIYLEANGTTIKAIHETEAGVKTTVIEATSSAVTGEGFIGPFMQGAGSSLALDNFSGGALEEGAKTVEGKAAGTGTGTGTAKGFRERLGKASGSGTGSATAKGVREASAKASGSGLGAGSAKGTRTRVGSATGTGTGTGTAAGALVVPGIAHGSGTGAGSAHGIREASGKATGSGVGTGSAAGLRTRLGKAAGTGTGSGSAQGTSSSGSSGVAHGTGLGTGSASGIVVRLGVSHGAGIGSGAASGLHIAVGAASGHGLGAGTAASTAVRFAVALGTGQGLGAAAGFVTHSEPLPFEGGSTGRVQRGAGGVSTRGSTGDQEQTTSGSAAGGRSRA